MNLLQIACKNVRHRAVHYAAFFLGSTFAVWMLFLYSWLLGHPAMGPVVRHDAGPFLRMTQLITAMFSVFFMIQAHGSFVRARQKELGVLTVLGLTPRQLGALVRWENLIVGLGATALGLIIGNGSARIFGSAFMAVLRSGADLPYYFSWPATLICLGVFPAVMALATIVSQRRLRRLPLADILTGAARPKAPPRPSAPLAVLCAVLLGGVYAALLTMDDRSLPVLPMLAAGVLGTYLFFSQGGVALLARLKADRELSWKPDALFVLSQMAYKLRDNVGTLFLTSLMTTFVIALCAFMFSVQMVSQLGLNPNIHVSAGMAGFRLMVVSFISLLFFLGAGNVLYFKLFTDLPDDRRQFRVLYKLGLGVADIRRIIGIQTAVMFFLPGLFAAVNALIIQLRMMPSVGPAGLLVLAGVLLVYGLLQGAYLLVTVRTYMRRLMSGPPDISAN